MKQETFSVQDACLLRNSAFQNYSNLLAFMKHEFDHAGFVETSIMLAISDKVKMKKAKKGLIIEGLSKLEQSAELRNFLRNQADFLRLQRTECGVTQLVQQRRTERSFLQKL